MSQIIQNYQATLASEWPESFPVRVVDLQTQPLIEHGQPCFAWMGFECDIGVRRNHGRAGAALGPVHCRKALAKLEWQLPMDTAIFDVGNIMTPDDDLETAQQQLAWLVAQTQSAQAKSIVIGGGHEVAYGHYLGLCHAHPTKNIGIINLDAHFDLRPCVDGKGNSGTPFLQIAQHVQQRKKPFHYCVLGIQPQAGSDSLFQTADALHVIYRTAEQMRAMKEETAQVIMDFCNKVDLVYLTIDLDVFAMPFAPGVSAAQIFGLLPDEVLPLLKLVCQTQKVIGFDIAELAPKYDIDERTATLGAALIHYFIHHC